MENKFYNELKKFKKAEKVELGITHKAEEFGYELEKGAEILSDFIQDIIEAQGKGAKELNRLEAVLRIGEKTAKEIEGYSKELGIKVPELDYLNKRISNFKPVLKRANKFLK